jgi:hypothetical protein
MTRFAQENVRVPVIIQTVGGDLRLRGRPGGWLVMEGDAAQVEQIGEGQPYVVRCDGDARLTVPDNVAVSIQNVGGDAKLTDLGGVTDIHNIGGDLIARNIGSAQIKNVGGDLRLKRADGPVTVERVGADATIREVGGAVRVAQVGADLYLRNVEGGCVAENIGADLVLNIGFLPGQEYRFGAGGDILCRVQSETNARFIAPADTEIRLDVAVESATSEDDDQQIITVGDGSATVQITRADTLQLVGEEDDYMVNLGTQIEEELDARMSSLEEKLSRQLEGLDERIFAKTEQFASQAERFAHRAQRQAERARERVMRSMERQAVKRKPGPGRRIIASARIGESPSRASDPVTEQERLMILQMVRDNKISIEEAERLLSALEK